MRYWRTGFLNPVVLWFKTPSVSIERYGEDVVSSDYEALGDDEKDSNTNDSEIKAKKQQVK